jgi:hypothetical protein
MHIKARLSVQQATEDKDLRGQTSPTRNFNSQMIGPVQISPLQPAPDLKKNRPTTSSIYCNICKKVGNSENVCQAITPETARKTPILPERKTSRQQQQPRLRDDFKDFARSNTVSDSYYTGSGGYGTLKKMNDDKRMNEDDPRHQPRSASLDDDVQKRIL